MSHSRSNTPRELLKDRIKNNYVLCVSIVATPLIVSFMIGAEGKGPMPIMGGNQILGITSLIITLPLTDIK